MALNNTSTRVVVGLITLSVVGYAYMNPAAISTCTASCKKSVAWVRQQVAPLQASFKKSRLYASYSKALREHEIRALKRKSVPAVTPAAPPPLDLSPEAVRRREQANWSVGQKIAYGSAFAQHGKELGFKTEDQMASHIDRVIGYAGPSTTKELSGGRMLYWDERTRCVVIVNPGATSGTMFKPVEGYPYFKDAK